MRLSQTLLTTWREAPADADTLGTVMLTRAGYIRKVGAGLYASLPFMTRVLHKLEGVIREELSPISQEVSFPLLQPEALWRASGRWEGYTQAEGIMFTVTDRGGRQHALGPTHEEVALDVIRGLVRGYRDLPVSVFQFGRKFRDELRPRFGLLRTREFVMKDAYSFHADEHALHEHFEAMSEAYAHILSRLGIKWRVVEADSGSIGGQTSREFMVLSGVGEDEVLFTPDGLYAANTERAESRPSEVGRSPFDGFEVRDTLGTVTVTAVCEALKCSPGHLVKNVLYDAFFMTEGRECLQPVLVSVRGDHNVNHVKLWNAVEKRISGTLIRLELSELGEGNSEKGDLKHSNLKHWAARVLPLGYLAPDLPDDVLAQRAGLSSGFLRLCDEAAAAQRDFATGANETDRHVVGANWGQDFRLPDVVNIRQALAGESAWHDPGQVLQSARGIEVGHVFQLGTRYASAMNATFTDADGQRVPFQMGCYGIGVTRLAQAVAEQLADERGLNWPDVVAPYQVIVTLVDGNDAVQVDVAEQLYTHLLRSGAEVLLDDRALRPGVKFADADLLGIPWRVTVGRGAVRGEVEVKRRRTGEQGTVQVTALQSGAWWQESTLPGRTA